MKIEAFPERARWAFRTDGEPCLLIRSEPGSFRILTKQSESQAYQWGHECNDINEVGPPLEWPEPAYPPLDTSGWGKEEHLVTCRDGAVAIAFMTIGSDPERKPELNVVRADTHAKCKPDGFWIGPAVPRNYDVVRDHGPVNKLRRVAND